VTHSPLDRYFDAIDRGDVEATTSAFAADATYIRPSLDSPGALDVARGREQLRAYFEQRGKKPFRHIVESCVVDGPECFVEGEARQDGKAIASFLVHATLDEDGLITRYFALMGDVASEPEPTSPGTSTG
jgi:ketosteroid isomerase-like protein